MLWRVLIAVVVIWAVLAFLAATVFGRCCGIEEGEDDDSDPV